MDDIPSLENYPMYEKVKQLEATNAVLRAEIAVLDRRIEDMKTVNEKLTSLWIKTMLRISELEADPDGETRGRDHG